MSEQHDDSWTVAKVHEHGFIHLLDSMPHWHHKHAALRWGGLGAGDIRIVQAARVSTGHLPPAVLEELGLETADEDRTPEQDVKLIRYLMKNRHTSPLEKVRFEFVVKVPIFIARQWQRHRMGSFSEVSARYSVLPKEFYIPSLERMQAQHSTNKQASGAALNTHEATRCQEMIRVHSEVSYAQYERLLAQGLARELARTVLPNNIYTQFYWTVDLHNLLHWVSLRIDDHAQSEIAAYAHALVPMVKQLVPVAFAAFEARQSKYTLSEDGKYALETIEFDADSSHEATVLAAELRRMTG